MDQNLVLVYERATYNVVEQASHFVLTLGAKSERLAKLYREFNLTTAAFVTAHNPRSVPHPDDANVTAQAALRRELDKLPGVVFPALGEDPEGQHPSEPSFWALGIDLATASKIALSFDQNAILFAEADATPRLVMLREVNGHEASVAQTSNASTRKR